MSRGEQAVDIRGVSILMPLDDVSALSDSELTALLERLETEERSLSRRRNALHNRIDFGQAGSVAPGDSGEDHLAELREAEREISARRHALHLQIEQLRAEELRRRPGG
jgi:RsiG-like